MAMINTLSEVFSLARTMVSRRSELALLSGIVVDRIICRTTSYCKNRKTMIPSCKLRFSGRHIRFPVTHERLCGRGVG
jgi:hypothetical protein